jgi:hypothetical protein
MKRIPYFIDNDIFSGRRGGDSAYLMQNVIEAQSSHLRRWPRRAPLRRAESGPRPSGGKIAREAWPNTCPA